MIDLLINFFIKNNNNKQDTNSLLQVRLTNHSNNKTNNKNNKQDSELSEEEECNWDELYK